MALNRVLEVPDRVPIRTALISAWDKTDLKTLARQLFEICPGLRIFSTGGSLSLLREALREGEERILPIERLTGNPEIQGGLVKTLDYRIYLGLLTEPFNPEHAQSLQRYGVPPIDLVVVNLYPFEEVTAQSRDLEMARSYIDIGGPTLLRAAAKNFHRVLVLSDPGHYGRAVDELRVNGGCSTLRQRFQRAVEAFRLVSRYDGAIERFLADLDESALDAYRLREL